MSIVYINIYLLIYIYDYIATFSNNKFIAYYSTCIVLRCYMPMLIDLEFFVLIVLTRNCIPFLISF